MNTMQDIVFLSCKFGAIQNQPNISFLLALVSIIKVVSSKPPIFTISSMKPVSKMFFLNEGKQ